MSVSAQSMAIAVVGMSGRYPDARDLDQFWSNLKLGRDSVREIPRSRWNVDSYFDPDPTKKGKIYCKWLGALDGIADFDPLFFNIAPKEADYIDPQHRLFLQEAYAAFENGAFRPSSLSGSKCGVYLGLMSYEYGALLHQHSANPSTTANSSAIAAARVSYMLDLKGPAIAIDTACSSSLAATHFACRALQAHEIDMALVGGVSLYLTPASYIGLCGAMMLSPDGRCRAFDQNANGFVPGEGVGAIVLKRREDAERDRDIIYGVIVASGVNQDGKTNGISAPNRESQIALHAQVHQQHSIAPETVTYVEAHGTGTKLGDPIELEALAAAFGRGGRRQQLCAIGSVKTNIGHASAAAGIAGLHKVLLQLRHCELAPTLHFQKPNEHFDFERSPLAVNVTLRPWDSEQGAPRRAGINSFGFSGTNAHIVVEEYTGPNRHYVGGASLESQARSTIIVISAKSPERLDEAARRLLAWIEAQPALDVRDVGYTLQVGREHMEERLAFIADVSADLASILRSYLNGTADAKIVRQRVKKGDALSNVEIDGNLRRFLASLAQKNKLYEIAQLWARGFNVDWSVLHGTNLPRRVALPTYPFLETAHWIPEAEAVRPRAVIAATPAVEIVQPQKPRTKHHTVTITGDEILIRDHVLNGARLLPGVVYLDMTLTALSELLADDAQSLPLALRNVVWSSPLIVNQEPRMLHMDFAVQDDGSMAFKAYGESKEGARTVYCQGVSDRGVGPSTPLQGSVDGRASTELQRVSADECYDYFRTVGLDYGPSLRVLQELRVGPAAVMGWLAVPPCAAEIADRSLVHPSLLDGALQACVGLGWGERRLTELSSDPMVPFGIDELMVYAKCTTSARICVRPRHETATSRYRSFDIDMVAADGSPCVSIRGLSFRPARPAQAPARADEQQNTLLLHPVWFASRPLPSTLDSSSADAVRQHVVVLCDVKRPDIVSAIAARVRHCRPISLKFDSPTAAYDDAARFTFFATRLLEEIKSQSLNVSASRIEMQVVICNRDRHDLLGGLEGLLRTAELELPWFTGQLICCDDHTDIVRAVEQDARCLSDKRVRYRDGNREVRVWEDAGAMAGQPSIPWHDHGVYLITGGTRGVGYLFAEEIAARAQSPRLILAGRRAPSDVEAAVARLRQAGGQPTVEQVDVTDRIAVERLIKRILSDHGRLDGVIHAAGIIDDRALLQKSAAEFASVLAPKVAGLVHLDEALGNSPLDLFVVLSSISALGNVGQADYAAANAFMDCFVTRRNAQAQADTRRGFALSVNWPLWQAGGMSVRREVQAEIERRTGLAAISTKRAFKAFYNSWTSRRDQSLVLEGDAQKIKAAIFPKLPIAPYVIRRKAQDECKKPQKVAGARAGERTTALSGADIERELAEAVSALVHVDAAAIDTDANLTDYGFDSVAFAEFARLLSSKFAADFDATIFYEHPTIAMLALYIFGKRPAHCLADAPVEQNGKPARLVSAGGTEPLELHSVCHSQPRSLAVIGMSGCFPMAGDIDDFWRNLLHERDCISEVPPARRRQQRVAGHPASMEASLGPGGFIEDIDAFDPLFFGIAPIEAQAMDPQQRLLMMHVLKAIEDAGYAPSSLAGTKTGLFVGAGSSAYSSLMTSAGHPIEGFSSTAAIPSMGPNRISFFLDLRGPSEAIETACSSSLVALHHAMEAINGGSCDLAIVGGVNTIVSSDVHLSFRKAGMLAPDGRCKTFSDRADGYVRGEGIGIIVLKPLARAEHDRDHIYGVISGTAVNHGGRAASLTAPNPRAQAEVIKDAYRRAGIDPRTIGYIEAHGTGTALGDPIELNGLKAAFSEMESPAAPYTGPFCGLGSVKSNIGHLELAAGIAGVIKVLLQLKHRTLVRTLHCEDLNPQLRLEGSPFYIVQETKPWLPVLNGSDRPPLRAGVSSFGFGGTNAHAVIEEYIPDDELPIPLAGGEPVIIVFSAKDDERLRERLRQLITAIDAGNFSDEELPRIAYTLQVGRDAMDERLAFTASSIPELRDKLILGLEPDSRAGGIFRGRVQLPRAVRSTHEISEPLENRRYDEIMSWWVDGADIVWESLWSVRPRRIRLPTYSFAKERYWPAITPEIMAVETQRAADPADAESDRTQSVARYLINMLADALGLPPHRIDPHVATEKYGVDSVMALKLLDQFERAGLSGLPRTTFFEHRTLWEIAAFLTAKYPGQVASIAGAANNSASAAATLAPTLTAPRTPPPGHISDDAAIAIVAIAGRYPKADNLQQFWVNLCEGLDCVAEVPPDRWEPGPVPGGDNHASNASLGKWGGFIDGVDRFDPLLFGILPADAPLIDPHDRLFLETVWELFELAGTTREDLKERYSSQVGVYVGAMYRHYQTLPASAAAEAATSISSYWSIANRVSYFFGLRGPSLAVDTACSSGLVAVHLACESLRKGECQLAIAGAVNLHLHEKKYVGLALAGVLASNKDRRSFADGDGYIPAEAVGAVLLKPLRQALADGDSVLAVIRATAVNHGGRTNGFLVPSTDAQAELIADNFRRSGVNPRSVSYVEAAATGSAMADQLEISGLVKAFRQFDQHSGYCAIGSVKSNIGHAEAASGISQLTKVVLQLKHKMLVPSIKAQPPNPDVSFDGTPFFLQQKLEEWKRPVLSNSKSPMAEREWPLRGTVSSFGVGGSNAHVILEEYQEAIGEPLTSSSHRVSPQIIILSARTAESLRELVRRVLQYVESTPELSLERFAYTLQCGREALSVRLAFVAGDRGDIVHSLKTYLGYPADADAVQPALFPGAADSQSAELASVLASDAAAAMAEDLLKKGDLDKVAIFWSSGGNVPWRRIRQRVPMLQLPTYPFARDRYWIADQSTRGAPCQPARQKSTQSGEGTEKLNGMQKDEVLEWLTVTFAAEMGLSLEQLRPKRDIREYGADSLLIAKLLGKIERRFGLRLNYRDLSRHRSLAALAEYVALHRPTSIDQDKPRRDVGDFSVLDHFRNGQLTLAETRSILLREAAPPPAREKECGDRS